MKRIVLLFLLATTASIVNAASLRQAVFADGTVERDLSEEEAAEAKPIPLDPRFNHLYQTVYIPVRVIINAANVDLKLFRRGNPGWKAYAIVVNQAWQRKDGMTVCEWAANTKYDGKSTSSLSFSARAEQVQIVKMRSMVEKAINAWMPADLSAAVRSIKNGEEGSCLAFVQAMFNCFEIDVIQKLESMNAELRSKGVFADEELALDILAGFEQLLMQIVGNTYAIIEMTTSPDEQDAIRDTSARLAAQLIDRLTAAIPFESVEAIALAVSDASDESTELTGSERSSFDSTAAETDSGVSSVTASPGKDSPTASPRVHKSPGKSCIRTPSVRSPRKSLVWLDEYKEPQHWADAFDFPTPSLDLDVWGLIDFVPGVGTARKVAGAACSAVGTARYIAGKVYNLPLRDSATMALEAAFEGLCIAGESLKESGLTEKRIDGGCPCCDWQRVWDDNGSDDTEHSTFDDVD